MRFYQLAFTARQPGAFPSPGQEASITNPGASVIEWFGTERDAVRRRLGLFKAGLLLGKKSDHPIWAIDVPTSKPGLLRWLQEGGV